MITVPGTRCWKKLRRDRANFTKNEVIFALSRNAEREINRLKKKGIARERYEELLGGLNLKIDSIEFRRSSKCAKEDCSFRHVNGKKSKCNVWHELGTKAPRRRVSELNDFEKDLLRAVVKELRRTQRNERTTSSSNFEKSRRYSIPTNGMSLQTGEKTKRFSPRMTAGSDNGILHFYNNWNNPFCEPYSPKKYFAMSKGNQNSVSKMLYQVLQGQFEKVEKLLGEFQSSRTECLFSEFLENERDDEVEDEENFDPGGRCDEYLFVESTKETACQCDVLQEEEARIIASGNSSLDVKIFIPAKMTCNSSVEVEFNCRNDRSCEDVAVECNIATFDDEDEDKILGIDSDSDSINDDPKESLNWPRGVQQPGIEDSKPSLQLQNTLINAIFESLKKYGYAIATRGKSMVEIRDDSRKSWHEEEMDNLEEKCTETQTDLAEEEIEKLKPRKTSSFVIGNSFPEKTQETFARTEELTFDRESVNDEKCQDDTNINVDCCYENKDNLNESKKGSNGRFYRWINLLTGWLGRNMTCPKGKEGVFQIDSVLANHLPDDFEDSELLKKLDSVKMLLKNTEESFEELKRELGGKKDVSKDIEVENRINRESSCQTASIDESFYGDPIIPQIGSMARFAEASLNDLKDSNAKETLLRVIRHFENILLQGTKPPEAVVDFSSSLDKSEKEVQVYEVQEKYVDTKSTINDKYYATENAYENYPKVDASEVKCNNSTNANVAINWRTLKITEQAVNHFSNYVVSELLRLPPKAARRTRERIENLIDNV
ncbi:uncharacterized protein LOC105696355 isoform X2 [Orussus abietinus]|uniref:uncharacterized protein LOC105696355 isoform X2 n=1 Tax=Orussus abietinus TaxID=222816 RepID=UPI000626101B|nr:uncharacterized protein LOC105696355 isoform X2 [Orussus abietinus]